MDYLATLITKLFKKYHWSLVGIPLTMYFLVPAYRRWGTYNFNVDIRDSYNKSELADWFANDISSMSIQLLFFIAMGWGLMVVSEQVEKEFETTQSLWKRFAFRIITLLVLLIAAGFAGWYVKEYGAITREESLPLRWLGAAFMTVILLILMANFLLANAGKKALNRTACMSAIIIALLIGGTATIAEIHHIEIYSKDRMAVVHMMNGDKKMDVTVIDMTEKKLIVYNHVTDRSEELYRSSVKYYFETIKNGVSRKVYVNPGSCH